jgi:1-aminocyclopropane-1-carboxylate deaminase
LVSTHPLSRRILLIKYCGSLATAGKISLKETDIISVDVVLDKCYHAECYNIQNPATVNAIKFGAVIEGFIIDSIYEGKSLAGLIDIVRKNKIKNSKTVLFAYLGGQLALNAYTDI